MEEEGEEERERGALRAHRHPNPITDCCPQNGRTEEENRTEQKREREKNKSGPVGV